MKKSVRKVVVCAALTGAIAAPLTSHAWFFFFLPLGMFTSQDKKDIADFQRRGDWSGLLAYSEGKLAKDPNSADWNLEKGWALMNLNRLDDAKVSLTRALEIQPKYAIAQNNLAAIAQREGKMEQALNGFLKAHEMDDWNGLIIENLVRVYSDLGQQQKAWDMQEKLIKADARRAEAMQAKYRFPSIRPVTQDPPMQFNVAAASTPKPVIQPVASRVCGDGAHLICSAIQAESTTSTTIKDAQSAVVASPDNVDNWIALGIAYRENSQLDEGERALLEAVRRSPNSARAITELGRIEKAKGNTAKLAELHGNLTKIDSSAAEAYFRELILP